MNLLNTLTLAADEEQLRLRPLPEHAAASQAEHLRQHYALLLAAVLTAQPAVSEPQTRLLRLLLDSLKLGDIRGQLFEQARELTPEPLLEAARLIREAGFAPHVLVDVLVLLRLDAPLSDETAQLAGELAAFLGLSEAELATRATDASEILGLNAGNEVSRNDGGNTSGVPALLWFSLADFWPGQLRQPLTNQALRAGLQGGLWVLDRDLDVDFAWRANDAILFFSNDAILNTFAKEGEIKLTGCRLAYAVLDVHGNCCITLERCNWQGDYNPKLNRTALHVIGGRKTRISNCNFSTVNARAIYANTELAIENSNFTCCGHGDMDGGAVLLSNNSRSITNCRFDRCLASRGGAIWVEDLYNVRTCEFVACQSMSLSKQHAGDVAVYATRNTRNPVLTNCIFRQTSISAGDSYYENYRLIAVDCKFIDSTLIFSKLNTQKLATNCTFERSQTKDKAL
jgi:hypothetical protein